LGGRLQVALGVGLEPVAGLGQGALLADAGDDIGERLAVGAVVEGIGGGDERRARVPGELVELTQARALAAAVGEGGSEMDAAGGGGGEPIEALDELSRESARRQHDEDLSCARLEEFREREMALALDGAAVAGGEEAAQSPVG